MAVKYNLLSNNIKSFNLNKFNKIVNIYKIVIYIVY